ncbi:MAG: CocE/NonD family hydrolase C-terminal non-catalytic domain-containing protein, partial [Candidatus Dormibacteraceae bacterium]
RTPDLARIEVPLLSSANWGGQGLHPRGNFEGFTQSASQQKWLDVHGDTHFTNFYTDYGVRMQKRFFGYFLKGEDNGWDSEPRVRLQVRHADGRFVERHEKEWPLARTRWTPYHLDLNGLTFSPDPPAEDQSLAYSGLDDGVSFSTAPLTEGLEITGPIAARLWISSSTPDADLFLILRVLRPDGQEVVFQGSNDRNTPIAQGWLRASHRRLDRSRSLPYRPYHSHDQVEPLTPGEVYALDVEIWPTCIVIPVGYRLALSVQGTDYEYAGDAGEEMGSLGYKGCGPFVHSDPEDRPPVVFGGQVTIYSGPDRPSHILLPVIPAG